MDIDEGGLLTLRNMFTSSSLLLNYKKEMHSQTFFIPPRLILTKHKMKKILGIISLVLFLVSAVFGIREMFFVGSWLGYSVMLFLLTASLPSVIGFILSFFTTKEALKVVGILGNGAIMFLTVVLPLAANIFFPLQ
jgi:hypothetical protein